MAIDTTAAGLPRHLGVKIAVVLLGLLALVTWLGTLAAARDGVSATQVRIFDALLWWQPCGAGFELPLPGVRLLLLLLFCTLILDRSAWSWRRGRRAVTTVHAGVALLLASALWSWLATRDATLHLQPGEETTQMQTSTGTTAMPFALRFVDFRRELHPGVATLADLWVDVEVRGPATGAVAARHRITLNEPLRRDGLSVHLDETERLGDTGRYGAATFRVLHDPSATARSVALALLVGGMLAQFAGKLRRALRPAP
jgi:hypothetical protein